MKYEFFKHVLSKKAYTDGLTWIKSCCALRIRKSMERVSGHISVHECHRYPSAVFMGLHLCLILKNFITLELSCFWLKIIAKTKCWVGIIR